MRLDIPLSIVLIAFTLCAVCFIQGVVITILVLQDHTVIDNLWVVSVIGYLSIALWLWAGYRFLPLLEKVHRMEVKG